MKIILVLNRFVAGLMLLSGLSVSHPVFPQTSASFSFSYSEELTGGPLSGRLLLLVSQDTATDPDLPDPFHPFITFGRYFSNWHPGETLILNQQNADCFGSFPDSLTGWIALRAVVDTDPESSILVRDGTCFSDKITARIEHGKPNNVPVPITQMLRGRGFREKPNIRLLEVESPLLSAFYGKPTSIEAAVLLPASYFTDSLRSYPTMFVFPGWGTTHTAVTQGTFQQKRYGMTGTGQEKIVVFLNQDCRFGFHVFADSENNGPRATSFVTEFLPAFEAQYRAVPHREARFLTGQSSGAWAALWLMIQYPDTFGMAWAASPDPVDFSRFLNVDLYSPDANFYSDPTGTLRNGIDSDTLSFPLRDWIRMEKALGDGGQFQSFEAVFGGKAANGLPDQLFDRETGKIIPSTLKSWEAYDINRILLSRGEALKEPLDGRITIVVADDDPFFLDEPVKTLKNTMDSLGIEADIRVLEKGGHNTWTDSIREEIHRKMDRVTVPFTLDHSRMIIHGDIRKKDGSRRNIRIWVDTGNPDFFLSPELAADLGIPIPPDSLIPDHGFIEVPFPGELRIGGRKMPTDSIPCYVVMKRHYFFTATHCDLNLPSSVLRQYDVQFDYPAGKLSLSPSGKGTFRGLPVNALIHPVTGIVQITAMMDEDSLSFALDNGASYSFGSTELMEKLRSKHPEAPVCQGAAGGANIWGMPFEPATHVIRIPELAWGTHRLSGLGMAIPPDFTEDGQGMMDWYSRKTVRPVDGFLGPNAYLQFCLGIDYNHQLVYVSDAGKRIEHDLDMVGLILAPEADSSWVIIGSTTIDGKSLVEEVQPGDILVEINGIPVKGETMGVVVDALRGEPGEVKTLLIKRDGTMREITDVRVKRIL